MDTANDLEALLRGLDELLSESAERRRFMLACSKLSAPDLARLQRALKRGASLARSAQDAADVEEPLQVAHALLHLDAMLERTSSRALLAFLFGLLERKSVFKALNRLRDPYWELCLLLNRHLSAEQIGFLWRTQRDLYIQSLDHYAVRLLARQRHCPAEVLEALFDIDDVGVRHPIARYRQLPESIARKLVNSRRKPERIDLARNPHVAADTLLALLRDSYPEIADLARKALRKRFPDCSISEPAIEAAIQRWHDDPQRSTRPRKPKADPCKLAVLDHGAATALKSSSERATVARTTRDPDVLVALAADANKAVRFRAAANWNTPESCCQALIGDADLQVSTAALEVWMRKHPDGVAEALLSGQAMDAVRDRIGHHLQHNTEVREWDSSTFSKTDAVWLKRMELVVRHTGEALFQLRIVQGLTAIPDSATYRWNLLKALAGNRWLCDAAVRRVAIDLNFGVESVMEHCRNPKLFAELFDKRPFPAGVRGRLERWLAALATET